MRNIREILKSIELHDSALESLMVKSDGSVELTLDIDDVWNKDLNSKISGILFKSVYEISDFKIDRLNIIGSVDIEDIDDYNKDFVTHRMDDSEKTVLVSIEFVAGGSLNIICSGAAELLICAA